MRRGRWIATGHQRRTNGISIFLGDNAIKRHHRFSVLGHPGKISSAPAVMEQLYCSRMRSQLPVTSVLSRKISYLFQLSISPSGKTAVRRELLQDGDITCHRNRYRRRRKADSSAIFMFQDTTEVVTNQWVDDFHRVSIIAVSVIIGDRICHRHGNN